MTWPVQIRSDQSLSRVRLFATPWIAARQASLSIINSRSSLRLMSIESAMPSSHLILCHPLLLLPPIPPSLRVFSNESTLRMKWPKYWSFSFSIIPWPVTTSFLHQSYAEFEIPTEIPSRCVHKLECKGETGRDRLGGYTKWNQIYELKWEGSVSSK